MKVQSAKAKGRRLQQRVASDILRAFPGLSEDDVVSRSMGAGGEDIMLSAAARRCVPLSLECKNAERLNIWCAIALCRANLPKHTKTSSCVVFSKNHESVYAAVEWKFLLRLLTLSQAGLRTDDGDGEDDLEDLDEFEDGDAMTTCEEEGDAAPPSDAHATAARVRQLVQELHTLLRVK
jgi:hypothetical protein